MSGETDEGDLRTVALMFWRHRRFLAACVILGGGLATLLGSQRPVVYTAEALLALSPQETRILSSEAVEPSLTPTEQNKGTQISILSSRQLARMTVEQLKLDQLPEFVSGGPQSTLERAWAQLKEQAGSRLAQAWMIASTTAEEQPAALDAPDPGAAVEEDPAKAAAVDAFLGRLEVRNVAKSHVIGVAFTSRDPEQAARIANTLSGIYVADLRRAKVEATAGASRWLETRVDELRAELIEAERAVERFRAENDLVELGGQTLSGENLADLNRQLQAAEAELAGKEALLRVVREQARAGGEIEPLAEAESSPLLQHLREQQAELRRQEAQLVASLGERHPRMRDLAAERADVSAKIAAELQRIVRQLENGVTVVRSRQRALRAELEAAKKRAATDRQAEIRLRELEREAAAIRDQYQAFLERFKQTTDQAAVASADARIISEAPVPKEPSSLGIAFFALFGLTTGAFAGGLGVVLRERFDTGLRSMDQIERQLGLGCLGLIPAVAGIRGRQTLASHLVAKPVSAFAESLRQVGTAVRMANIDRPAKVVLVTSTVPGEGKTGFATSYAISAALEGLRAVVVDLDLRQPAVTRRLALPEPSAGVAEVLSGEAYLGDALLSLHEVEVDVLPVAARPPVPAKLLQSKRLAEIVQQLKEAYDLVVLDSPPLLLVSDAQLIAPLADTTVMIVQWQKTPRASVARALALLRQSSASIAGAVLTQVNLRRHAEYGYGDVGSYYKRYRSYYEQPSARAGAPGVTATAEKRRDVSYQR